MNVPDVSPAPKITTTAHIETDNVVRQNVAPSGEVTRVAFTDNFSAEIVRAAPPQVPAPPKDPR